jgi:hypothetical protein
MGQRAAGAASISATQPTAPIRPKMSRARAMRRRPSRTSSSHRECGSHRALGVVLADPGHAEDGHDGVARVLLHRATERLDLLTHLVEEGGQQGAQLLGVLSGRKLRRPDEIGKENGDGLALVRRGSHARLC